MKHVESMKVDRSSSTDITVADEEAVKKEDGFDQPMSHLITFTVQLTRAY